MRFGTTALSKFEYAATIAASIAYLLLKQRDAMALRLFDDDLRAAVPLSNSMHNLHNLLTQIEPVQPKRKTDIGKPLREFAEQSGRRALVIILTDLFAPLETLEEGLTQLRFRNHEVVLFHVLDESELSFPFEDNTKFVGLEEMPDLIAEPRSLRDGYLAVVEEFLADTRKLCAKMRIDYSLCSTGERLDKVLATFLAARARVVRSSSRRR